MIYLKYNRVVAEDVAHALSLVLENEAKCAST